MWQVLGFLVTCVANSTRPGTVWTNIKACITRTLHKIIMHIRQILVIFSFNILNFTVFFFSITKLAWYSCSQCAIALNCESWIFIYKLNIKLVQLFIEVLIVYLHGTPIQSIYIVNWISVCTDIFFSCFMSILLLNVSYFIFMFHFTCFNSNGSFGVHSGLRLAGYLGISYRMSPLCRSGALEIIHFCRK